jgi:hypothetical protein
MGVLQCAQTWVIDCAMIYFLSRGSTNASLFHLVQLSFCIRHTEEKN